MSEVVNQKLSSLSSHSAYPSLLIGPLIGRSNFDMRVCVGRCGRFGYDSGYMSVGRCEMDRLGDLGDLEVLVSVCLDIRALEALAVGIRHLPDRVPRLGLLGQSPHRAASIKSPQANASAQLLRRQPHLYPYPPPFTTPASTGNGRRTHRDSTQVCRGDSLTEPLTASAETATQTTTSPQPLQPH